jgi:hypothetical protein
MASPVGQSLIVNIPVNNGMVQQAFDLFQNRCIRRGPDDFNITTNTVNHSGMDPYIQSLLEQHKDADTEVKDYIQRLKLISEGTQFAKAIVTGKENRIFVSVFVTSRIKTNTIDEHKILIASMERTFDLRPHASSLRSKLFSSMSPLNLIAKILFPIGLWNDLFGIIIDGQLEEILRQLNDEENKKCLEAMAFYILGERIQSYMGDQVEVRFIKN